MKVIHIMQLFSGDGREKYTGDPVIVEENTEENEDTNQDQAESINDPNMHVRRKVKLGMI